MSWFSRKTEPEFGELTAKENAVIKQERDVAKDYADAQAEIAAVVAEAEVVTRVKSTEVLTAAIADLVRDRETYRFECRRWGDFLSLFMERMTYEWRDGGFSPKQATYATSVNLKETRAIGFIEGYEPDENGVLRYVWQMWRDDTDKTGGYSWSSGDYGCPMRPSPEGYHYEVCPMYPEARTLGRMFVLDEKTGSYDHISGSSLLPNKTTNFARPAEDDRIRFDGIGATIFAPVGCGRDAHDAILREIAEKS